MMTLDIPVAASLLWLLYFGIGFGILMILSRDPYFNPKIRWCAVVPATGGVVFVASVLAGGYAYVMLSPLSHIIAISSSLLIIAVLTVLGLWGIIKAFV